MMPFPTLRRFMKILDTTRLSEEQLKVLALILKSLDERMPADMLGQRMSLSNIEHKSAAKDSA